MNHDFYQNRYTNNILVAGVTRNSEATIALDVHRLGSALTKFNSLQWLVIESDSEDNTIAELNKLQKSISNFRYVSLGILRQSLPFRTERIAYCRNYYIQEIKNNPDYKNIDYVVVADLDNLNTLITEESISSCWENNNWDVCTANQKGPYYDVFALRHPIWSPVDYSESMMFYKNLGLSNYDTKFKALYSKMITISCESDWILVDSAFGGVALYTRAAINNLEYKGLDENSKEICEHVPASLKLTKLGFKIYINPKLINCSYNEHTKQMKYLFLYRIRMNYLKGISFYKLFSFFRK